MARPRIIVADTDVNYILSLQLKFIEEFFEKIDLEIITDEEYFVKLFAIPQKAEILVVSEELYDINVQKHNIGNVFLMTERYQEESTSELNLNRIFKYTSTKEIFNEIINKSAKDLRIVESKKSAPQMILVYSPVGGVGKTTVALGISNSLSKNYKKVLYIDAESFHTFQHLLVNETSISSNEIYTKMARNSKNIYQEIRHTIRTEKFSYIPPLKAPLMSFGISKEIYLNLIQGAKKSLDYDFIVVDVDSTLDEEKNKLMVLADKVVIVTQQTKSAVYATNRFLASINEAGDDKYLFICNDFNKENENMLISPSMTVNFAINYYIEHFNDATMRKLESYSGAPDIQKIALLFL